MGEILSFLVKNTQMHVGLIGEVLYRQGQMAFAMSHQYQMMSLHADWTEDVWQYAQGHMMAFFNRERRLLETDIPMAHAVLHLQAFPIYYKDRMVNFCLLGSFDHKDNLFELYQPLIEAAQKAIAFKQKMLQQDQIHEEHKQQLFHEITVQQEEIQIQNDELIRKQEELIQVRNNFEHIFEQAPIPYFELNPFGIITRANIKGSELLKKTGHNSRQVPFINLIVEQDRKEFSRFLFDIYARRDQSHNAFFRLQSTEQGHEDVIYTQLSGQAAYTIDRRVCCRLAVSDYTEMRKYEEKIETILSTIPYPIIVTGLSDGFNLYTNRKAADLFGFDLADAGKQRSEDFYVNPNERQKFVELLSKYRQFSNMEVLAKNKRTGQVMNVLVSAQMIRFMDKVAVFAIFNDITEWKNTLHQLAESQKQFRIIAENAQDVIWLMDNEYRFTFITPSVMRMYGYSSKEFLEKKWSDLLTPDSLRRANLGQQERAHREAAGEQNVQIVLELEQIRASGEIFWTEVVTNRLRDETGHSTGFLGATRDITKRKKAEQEARLLSVVAAYTDNAVVITDAAGYIEWVNAAFEKITGYQLPEIIGQKPGKFLQGPESQPEAIRELATAIHEKRTAYVEIINYHKSGKKYWIQIYLSPVLDQDGEVTRYIAIESEITQRKYYEQTLQEQNLSLRKVNHELDQFVYRVSHDLRAPISSALGLVYLCKVAGEDGAAHTQYLQLMEHTLSKMDYFIRDIIDYAHNARHDTIRKEINLHVLIGDLLDIYAVQHQYHRVQVISEIFGDVPLCGDAMRIRIILNSLLSNAFKFVLLGKQPVPQIILQIHISTDQCRITIQDNGIGIPEEHQDKIFDMFYRATNESHGAGLGLYIAQDAAQKMGGYIRVQSVYGQGATFEAVFPNQLLPH